MMSEVLPSGGWKRLCGGCVRRPPAGSGAGCVMMTRTMSPGPPPPMMRSGSTRCRCFAPCMSTVRWWLSWVRWLASCTGPGS